MNIHVHIDRLVLHDVTGNPGEISEALRAELTRLLSATPSAAVWPESRTMRSTSGPEIRSGRSAVALGAAIAGSVHGGLVAGSRGVDHGH